MDKNVFPKAEHLCGDKKLNRLFTEGKAFIVYPFRIVYLRVEEEEIPVKVVISVSKKRFKRAVKRNKIKRLMRESYRLNKHELVRTVSERNTHLYISFQYVAEEVLSFQYIQSRMIVALGKLKDIADDL